MAILKVGQRVRLTRDVERFPDCLVNKGQLGTVTSVTDADVRVKLDVTHEGLEDWDNCIVWATWSTDELEEMFKDFEILTTESMEIDRLRKIVAGSDGCMSTYCREGVHSDKRPHDPCYNCSCLCHIHEKKTSELRVLMIDALDIIRRLQTGITEKRAAESHEIMRRLRAKLDLPPVQD